MIAIPTSRPLRAIDMVCTADDECDAHDPDASRAYRYEWQAAGYIDLDRGGFVIVDGECCPECGAKGEVV